ncbi:hypothetical protein L208DRAFT_1300200 [Tricholoma matsutake]|nr:hypothetical protein L208DRAFT_1300200 [Tricholoma matsutake 945]
MKQIYKAEVIELAKPDHGLHFSASNVSIEQLESFQMYEMATGMAQIAPYLWDLLDTLLLTCGMGNILMQEGDHHDQDNLAEEGLEGVFLNAAPSDRNHAKKTCQHDQKLALIQIKKVIILSIAVHSLNRNVNALQSIIAMFLQASKTPVQVINTLARIGISISTSSIDCMVDSLSSKSANKLQDLGQTLLACYAYDNFDVDLKTHVLTIDKLTDTLKHLTSALCVPLEHGITCEDMQCSDLLWAKSGLNPYADPSNIPPSITMEQLLNIHPEPDPEQFGGLSRRDRYNSWKFLFDLVHYGPVPFHALQAKIGKPDIIEQIPVTKTPITPARAMNCSNSSVSGNIETILNLMEQGGVGDPNDMDAKFEVVDVSPFVVLFHGDLGTGDQINDVQ